VRLSDIPLPTAAEAEQLLADLAPLLRNGRFDLATLGILAGVAAPLMEAGGDPALVADALLELWQAIVPLATAYALACQAVAAVDAAGEWPVAVQAEVARTLPEAATAAWTATVHAAHALDELVRRDPVRADILRRNPFLSAPTLALARVCPEFGPIAAALNDAGGQ
jgi:hypothetical protein